MNVRNEAVISGVDNPSSGRVPDFFIVGHQKSGTTALYETLRRHPQIFMPGVKEPRFFASDLRWPELRTSRPVVNTLEQYLSLFEAASSEQRVGEASPLYLLSQTAAGNIAEVQPAARAIAILREPTSYLRSYHSQCVKSCVETQTDLRAAIALEAPRREGKSLPRYALPQELLYADHVRYVEQLRRYHAVFPPEQILVLIYDDFRRDNEATVRKVLRFLEVDDSSPIEVPDANPTVRVRFQHLHALVHGVSVGRGKRARAVNASVKAVTPRKLRGKALELRRKALHATQRHVIYGKPLAPDENLMLELRRRFEPDVVATSEYLGRDLVSLWGYDDLG